MQVAAFIAAGRQKPPVAPRTYTGNMCGVRVPGLASVPGGAADASLVLSWFIDRYSSIDRQRIYAAWKAKGYVDALVSWPDSRAVGATEDDFVWTCAELVDHGFRPCVFLCSKDYDPPDYPALLARTLTILVKLIASGVAPRVCIGWELNLWLSPVQVQSLIDGLLSMCEPGAIVKYYVHFSQGVFAWEPDGLTTADFWKANVGKLTGILHQRDLSWDQPMYQARITDCLQRFAGQDNFPTDSGFSHPFDFIALEITAQPQFNGQMSEADGNIWGQVALTTPAVNGVHVMGSGNGS